MLQINQFILKAFYASIRSTSKNRVAPLLLSGSGTQYKILSRLLNIGLVFNDIFFIDFSKSFLYADSIFSETKKSTHSFVSTLSVWIFPYVMTLSNLLYSQSNSSILFLISAETELSFFKSRISSANISRFGFFISL